MSYRLDDLSATRRTAASATAAIGAGDNGVVTATVTQTGDAGNAYSLEVMEGVGNSQALSADLVAQAIVVTLATDNTGVKASADIGAGENGVVTATADVEGAAGNAYSIEVVEGVGLNQPLGAALDGSAITVTLATDGAGDPDDTANTAALIAAAVAALSGVTAVASGTGATAIDVAEGPTQFADGADPAPDDAANTATLIAAAVDALDGVTAVASGTGGTAIDAAEGPTSFTGGRDAHSVNRLAKLSGFSARRLQQVERGRPVEPEEALRIANALNTTLVGIGAVAL